MSEQLPSVLGFIAALVLAAWSFKVIGTPDDAPKLVFAWLVMLGLLAWKSGFHYIGLLVLFVYWFIVSGIGLLFSTG